MEYYNVEQLPYGVLNEQQGHLHVKRGISFYEVNPFGAIKNLLTTLSFFTRKASETAKKILITL